MNRREFLRTAGGAAGAAAATSAASGPVAAQEGSGGGGGGSGPIDFGGYLDDANGYSDSADDQTGNAEVTIQVGAGSDGMGFGPAAVHVDPGTTVIWEWTGEGGAHNVVSNDEAFNSGSPTGDAGTTFEHTFEEEGIFNYHCVPHEGSGMKGGVAVGANVPRQSAAAAQEVDPHEMGVAIQPHYVGFGAVLMMFMALVFTFYQLKYGESAHTKGGQN